MVVAYSLWKTKYWYCEICSFKIHFHWQLGRYPSVWYPEPYISKAYFTSSQSCSKPLMEWWNCFYSGVIRCTVKTALPSQYLWLLVELDKYWSQDPKNSSNSETRCPVYTVWSIWRIRIKDHYADFYFVLCPWDVYPMYLSESAIFTARKKLFHFAISRCETPLSDRRILPQSYKRQVL